MWNHYENMRAGQVFMIHDNNYYNSEHAQDAAKRTR